jgi:hypothetical protein
MKRKKRIFQTREEYRAWLESRLARERELRGHAERITAEIEAKRRTA